MQGGQCVRVNWALMTAICSDFSDLLHFFVNESQKCSKKCSK